MGHHHTHHTFHWTPKNHDYDDHHHDEHHVISRGKDCLMLPEGSHSATSQAPQAPRRPSRSPTSLSPSQCFHTPTTSDRKENKKTEQKTTTNKTHAQQSQESMNQKTHFRYRLKDSENHNPLRNYESWVIWVGLSGWKNRKSWVLY